MFAVDAAGSRMEAKVNGTSGDPRAWGHALGLNFSGIVHGFSMHNGCAYIKLFLRLFVGLFLEYQLVTNAKHADAKARQTA